MPQFRKGLTEFRGELDRRCFTRDGRPGKRHRIPGQCIRGDGFGGCQPILGDGRPAKSAAGSCTGISPSLWIETALCVMPVGVGADGLAIRRLAVW